MQTIVRCDEGDYPTLVEIWERSVRATHVLVFFTAILSAS